MLLTMLVLSVAACLFFSLQLLKAPEGGRSPRRRNLDAQVDTKWMYWDVKRHAENLNSIGDGMAAAVDKQLKSERLKTELITNVSHDIKTPLTSIINYVDIFCSMSTRRSRRKNTSPSSSGRRSSSKSSPRTWSRPARPRRATCP